MIEDEDAQPFGPNWLRAARIASFVNTSLINSDAPAPEKVPYIIEKGDSLVQIAERFATTVAAIQRGNRMAPTQTVIHPGRVLHIYRAEWSIAVHRERFALVPNRCLPQWEDPSRPGSAFREH